MVTFRLGAQTDIFVVREGFILRHRTLIACFERVTAFKVEIRDGKMTQ
jgi:hypothetical protein